LCQTIEHLSADNENRTSRKHPGNLIVNAINHMARSQGRQDWCVEVSRNRGGPRAQWNPPCQSQPLSRGCRWSPRREGNSPGTLRSAACPACYRIFCGRTMGQLASQDNSQSTWAAISTCVKWTPQFCISKAVASPTESDSNILTPPPPNPCSGFTTYTHLHKLLVPRVVAMNE